MCQQLLSDARFHRQLFEIDVDIAAQARANRCSACRGALHAASYPRKPRGVPEGLGAEFDRRLSFCCSGEDCRKRLTPPSVRFLDRRVYISVVVVLAAVLSEGLTGRRLRTLCAALEVDQKTVARWRQWWQDDVPRTEFFTDLRGRLDRPVDRSRLPSSLLERIEAGDDAQRLLRFLRLVDRLSHSVLMQRRFWRVA